MLDLQKIRDHLDSYKQVLQARNMDIDIDSILSLDDRRKTLQQEIDKKKHTQKQLAEQQKYNEAKSLKQDIQELEENYKTTVEQLDIQMLKLPNILHPDVPVGKDDSQNIATEYIGEKPNFDFQAKDHMTLMHMHDMIDMERGVKLAGARSYFLKNDGFLLEQAVLQLAYSSLIHKGFTPLSVPNIVNPTALQGTGYFPGGEDDAYHLEKDDKRLIATAEIPITAYHMNETLQEDELPKTYVGLSPCYRREAGSYGKDTAGLYRVHQFNKVEQVIILPADEALSNERHNTILRNARDLIESLEIPYRVLQLCTGDMALGKYNSHDLECRMPSRNSYGETHSATSFLDFQSRRLKLRYKTKNGEIKYCYTLNNTVVATPRILIALIENHQTADGKIRIPAALQPYMYGKTIIG